MVIKKNSHITLIQKDESTPNVKSKPLNVSMLGPFTRENREQNFKSQVNKRDKKVLLKGFIVTTLAISFPLFPSEKKLSLDQLELT